MGDKAARLEPPKLLGELPWLVYTHGNSKRKQVQTFYSPCNSEAYIKSIPQLRRKKILVSMHGWLLLQNQTQLTKFSLFNPATSRAITLPSLLQVWLDGGGHEDDDGEHCFGLCVLTLPQDRDDCMLVLCLDRAGLLAFCRPAQPDCSWVTQPLELQGEAVKLAHLVALNGVFYGITYSEVLFYAEDNYELKPLALKPLQTIMYSYVDDDFYCDCLNTSMLESCGHLYIVIVFLDYRGFRDILRIKAVKVLELNLQPKQNSYSLVEVKSLNGRTFFISNNDVSWCWGDSIRGIAPDCVYLSLNDALETLYLYNLLDQTCIILPPCPSLVSPCDNPFWVIPQHQHQRRLSASEVPKESIQKLSPIEYHELSQTHEEELTTVCKVAHR